MQIMGQKIWNLSSFLNLVKYYTIYKFYETIPIITNKKGHQKWTLLRRSKKNTDVSVMNVSTDEGIIQDQPGSLIQIVSSFIYQSYIFSYFIFGIFDVLFPD